MYTRDDWRRDRSFNAAPGEEITEDIYDDFYNSMPPLRFPVSLSDDYDGGFMNSEPYGFKGNDFTYATFGRKGNSYFFVGYCLAD